MRMLSRKKRCGVLLGDTVSWAVEASEKQVSMQPNPVTTGGQFKSVASTGELGNEGLGGCLLYTSDAADDYLTV